MGVFSFLGGGEAKPEVAAAAAAVPEVKKTPNCKICCACPDTRSARDTCVITTGAENCKEQIEVPLTPIHTHPHPPTLPPPRPTTPAFLPRASLRSR